MRTRKDEILELIFAPLGILVVIGGMVLVGTLATSCKSSIGVQQYQAEFEKAEPLNSLPALQVRDRSFNYLSLMSIRSYGICSLSLETKESGWEYQIE
jgi:hypothetical protein